MNTDVSLSDYDPQLALLQRQQKLAEMMQQQGQEPIQPTAYNGIQAPVSPYAALAKALQQYAGGMISHNAFQKQQDLSSQARTQAATDAQNLFQKPYAGDAQQAEPTEIGQVNVTPRVGSPVAKSADEQLAAALQQVNSGDPYTRQLASSVLPGVMQQRAAAQTQGLNWAHEDTEKASDRTYAEGQKAADRAYAEAHKPNVVVPADANLVDPNTKQPIFTGAPKPDDFERQAADLYGPNYKTDPRYQTALKNRMTGTLSPEREAQELRIAREKNSQLQAAMGAGDAPAQVDPNSNSILAQTGLSNAAFNALAYGQMPRGQMAYAAINKEIDEFAKKNGVDTATLRAQAKGYNDVLTSNLHRNNQGNILENEIQGTVQNLAPLADAIGAGKINAGNVLSIWAGKQVNDPTVQQYRDQLLRLREELAGYNAVAGGKLTESGTARVDDSDLRAAEAVINNGINSGGLKGLAASISASTGKNRAVLGKAIDDANQNMWGLFGVGKNYKRQYDQPSAGSPAAPAQPARPKRVDINGNPL